MVLGKISEVELSAFETQLRQELEAMLKYWQTYAVDKEFGGFVGQVDNFNQINNKAPKSIILNTRILWTFSRAGNFYNDSRYDEECQLAFSYLQEHFKDKQSGGVFWMVDHLGRPLDKRKQIYAQAFCIYALSEYYKYSKNARALVWAMDIFEHIEAKAYDPVNDGYIEAFGPNWNAIGDMRLSHKDLNAVKTTNTHLHILEAYTTLLEISHDVKVERALTRLHQLFLNRIFGYDNHMKLFFNRDWKKISTEISFGHDIEAVWLLLLSARQLNDDQLISKTEDLAINVVKTFVNEALDLEFGVINSKNGDTLETDTDRHWWPQAEAMVGLIHIWKITNDSSYYNICQQIWKFTTTYIIDHEYGEWFFRVDDKGKPYLEENKIGPWKCPYHNGRALMEILEILH